MPYTPLFSYFISPGKKTVTKNSAVWRQRLPLSRHFNSENSNSSPSHGEYFSAARSYLEKDSCKTLLRALELHLRRKVSLHDIREIHIRLEKHGEFYHPACVDVIFGRQKIPFALNVAVAETGIKIIKNEFDCISRLNHEFSDSFIPEVFELGEFRSAAGREFKMFLGYWFEGYHEFHISRDPTVRENKIRVWNNDRHPCYLSYLQSADLYRQAARILTYYYKVESFEQIFSWHHGAGDFVVKIDPIGLDVKLISVRSYAPLFADLVDSANKEMDPELILQALLIFFLNLSIRMRLDRYDGVGEIVWSDRVAVKSTLDGFFEGLGLKPPIDSLPDSIETCFRYYLSVCTREDLYELGKVVMNTFNRRAPELQVVKQHLSNHVEELDYLFRQIL
ncbi:MAG: hypothetical protein PVF37_01300 [Desulfobacterales bacterium]|jgi:hypothetical protein